MNYSEEELKAIEKFDKRYKQKARIVSEAKSNNCMSDFKCILNEEVEDWNTIKNLISKQQKEIDNIKQYAEWHISHLTETIADYIDDDKKKNADIIGELKEDREYWRDVIRIIKNEKTYINYNED